MTTASVTPETGINAKRPHIGGLDSIRFVCAVTVVLDHMHPPLKIHWVLAEKIYTGLFWGQPAVIIFFVISGFCIHYPQARLGSPLDVRAFLIRRLVRIGVPVVVLCLAMAILGANVLEINQGVFWSLYCEVAYYLSYPVLFSLARTTGWLSLFAGALCLSFLEMLRVPQPTAYYHHGFLGMMVLGLPIWLLGCILAGHRWDFLTFPPASQMLLWRAGMFAGGSFLNFLHFHAGIGFSWTLWVYGLAGVYWLKAEIEHASRVPMPRLLEAAGVGSYSLYICHLPIRFLCGRLGLLPDGWIRFLAIFVVILIGSALFYFLVEALSVKLARILSRRR